ncbi:MAG: hypothetical protein D6798_13885 [Deltaproteobacteria bacterium]|nr:MAG: hypothetical protein D6798_13885 [Deltaproteobacteria bacterium]
MRERIERAVAEEVGGEIPPVAAEQRALDVLRGVLVDMARRGRLRRRRVRGQYFLNTKGNRLVEVDMFSLPPEQW